MKENGNALLWVLLVLFPPIGIIYMWVKKKDFPQKKKNHTVRCFCNLDDHFDCFRLRGNYRKYNYQFK